HWFTIVPDYPKNARKIRVWDFAGTEEKKSALGTATNDPDWTVGTLMAEQFGQYWVIDVKRERLSPKNVEALVKRTAELDGRSVEIHIEQEPGSAGKTLIEDYQRRVLRGYSVYAFKPTDNKEVRAKPASAAAEHGNIFLVEG